MDNTKARIVFSDDCYQIFGHASEKANFRPKLDDEFFHGHPIWFYEIDGEHNLYYYDYNIAEVDPSEDPWVLQA